jgi:glycosyltransferase involved in cell wall biosynthesis
MAGQDKGLQAETERLAAELGLASSVRFPGFLTVEGKFDAGGQAHIFLNTNHVDNMPVSIVEACAMGLPVVATSVGGIRDLLTDRETGLLVPDGEVEAMAQAVLRLVDQPELASRLSENGRRLAERSSWLRVRPQWEAVFEEARTKCARNSSEKLKE